MRFAHQHRWLGVWTLIFAGNSLCQSGPAHLHTLFRQGAEQMHAGNAVAAEASFRKATELDPSFAPAHLDLGLAQLKEGKLLEAIASIKKSLELDPSSLGAHLFLGIAEYQSHHEETGTSDLDLA